MLERGEPPVLADEVRPSGCCPRIGKGQLCRRTTTPRAVPPPSGDVRPRRCRVSCQVRLRMHHVHESIDEASNQAAGRSASRLQGVIAKSSEGRGQVLAASAITSSPVLRPGNGVRGSSSRSCLLWRTQMEMTRMVRLVLEAASDSIRLRPVIRIADDALIGIKD